MAKKNLYSVKLPVKNLYSVSLPSASTMVNKPMQVKAKKSGKKHHRVEKKKVVKAKVKGGWLVTFNDGKSVEVPYYPNPRMAAGYALKQHSGKIKNIEYVP